MTLQPPARVSNGNQNQREKLFASGLQHGGPAIFISNVAEQFLLKPFSTTLIGRFVNGTPKSDKVMAFFQNSNFNEAVKIGKLKKNMLLSRCDSMEDFVRLRAKGTWHIDGCRIRITKYSSSIYAQNEWMHAPIWTEMPNLPPHLFQKYLLFAIANQIGDPVTLDNATSTLSRPNCARICVDMDLSKPLPSRIWIQESNGGFWQNLFYEKILPYCSKCSQLGHREVNCRANAIEKVSLTIDTPTALEWMEEISKIRHDKKAQSTVAPSPLSEKIEGTEMESFLKCSYNSKTADSNIRGIIGGHQMESLLDSTSTADSAIESPKNDYELSMGNKALLQNLKNNGVGILSQEHDSSMSSTVAAEEPINQSPENSKGFYSKPPRLNKVSDSKRK